MFGIGGLEFFVLCLIALFLVGPKQLPTVVGQVGRWIRKATRLRDEWISEIRNDPSVKEITRSFDEARDPVQKLKRELEKKKREIEESLEESTEILERPSAHELSKEESDTREKNPATTDVTEIMHKPEDGDKK